MPYTRPYPNGFQADTTSLATSTSLQTSSTLQTNGSTPITAAVLNAMELEIKAVNDRYQVAASAADRPSPAFDGQLVYRTDLGWLELYRGESWEPATPTGSVVQFGFKRSDAQVTYSSPTSGNGTTVSELALTMTPRYADSLVILEYMINGEYDDDWDNMWLIHQNGVLMTNPPAYNATIGNTRSSGVAIGGPYDADNSSTPFHTKLTFVTPAYTTTARTYAPATRDTGAGGSTLYLNRTIGAAGSALERLVSYAVYMEIAG